MSGLEWPCQKQRKTSSKNPGRDPGRAEWRMAMTCTRIFPPTAYKRLTGSAGASSSRLVSRPVRCSHKPWPAFAMLARHSSEDFPFCLQFLVRRPWGVCLMMMSVDALVWLGFHVQGLCPPLHHQGTGRTGTLVTRQQRHGAWMLGRAERDTKYFSDVARITLRTKPTGWSEGVAQKFLLWETCEATLPCSSRSLLM
jgi:hypothetical protein